MSESPVLRRIVSGGQTGVDRAALDAALARGFPCGGWCPQGRWSEDGPIPGRYPLCETDSPDPADRTEANVRDSDATVVIAAGPLVGGTRLTAALAMRLDRPLCRIDIGRVDAAEAVGLLAGFVEEQAVGVLNVAGPRCSQAPEAGEMTLEIVGGLLDRMS
ncbi:MAG: putative molybdenum carrier protein [Gammaproteobacteria bacterium]